MDGNADDMAPALGIPNSTTGVIVGALVADTGRHTDERAYAVIEQPQHGFVSVWPTGGFIYTPDPRARLQAYRSGIALHDGFTATITGIDGTTTPVTVGGVPVLPARAAVIATVPVGDRPRVPALNPDDSRVYVTHQDEPIVTVIDALTYTTMEAVALDAVPTDVTFSVDGRSVFVAHGDDSVSVLDADSFSVIDVLDALPATGLAVRSHNGVDVVAIIDEATNLDLGDATHVVAVNAAGTCAFVTNMSYGTVSVVKIATPPH